MFIMTDGDNLPINFCSETYFAVSCIKYTKQDRSQVAEYLLSMHDNGKEFNPIVLSDGEHKEILKELNKNPLVFSANGLWFMPMVYLDSIDLRLDSKTFFYAGNQTAGFTLHESYAIMNGDAITTKQAMWEPGDGNEGISKLANIMERRSNLNGAVLKHAWFEDPPYVTYIRDESGNVVDYVGYNAALLEELQNQMNFRIEHIPATVPHWGSKNEDGSWSGIVGMLVDKTIDISAIGLLMMPERRIAVDLCYPTFREENTLMTAITTKNKLNVWVFMEIFPITAWAATFAFTIVTALSFSLMARQSISQGMTLMVRLFIQLGYDVRTPTKASRMLVLVSAMSFCVIFIYYTSDLTTRMTTEPPKLSIRSFEDVITKGYKVVAYEDGMDALIDAPRGSAMEDVYKNHMLGPGYDDKYEAISVFLNEYSGDKVLLYGVFDPYSEHELEKQLTGLNVEEGFPIFEGVGLQKNSEFTEMFNYHIFKLYEMGVMDRLKHKYVDKPNKEFGFPEAITLGYENLLFPFGFIVLGMILAASAILVEHAIVMMGKVTKTSSGLSN